MRYRSYCRKIQGILAVGSISYPKESQEQTFYEPLAERLNTVNEVIQGLGFTPNCIFSDIRFHNYDKRMAEGVGADAPSS